MTAGHKDYNLRDWNFNPIVLKSQVGEPIRIHQNRITDLVEISHPPCIITCSMDKTIKMYNLESRVLIKELTGHHTNGIKQLKFIPGFGGQLISRGFEISVQIWIPENFYGNPYYGKLKGHTKPVVAMDNLKNQPYLMTMDELS